MKYICDVCIVYGRCIGIDWKTDNGGDIVHGILHYRVTEMENRSGNRHRRIKHHCTERRYGNNK
jgi:hypothetical protein